MCLKSHKSYKGRVTSVIRQPSFQSRAEEIGHHGPLLLGSLGFVHACSESFLMCLQITTISKPSLSFQFIPEVTVHQ